MAVDNRGSYDQRVLYSMLKELYPAYEIVYEFQLPNGQRFDLFIPALGIAVEYQGAQHYKFTEHWHKDINGFINQKRGDIVKAELSEQNGIKLVTIDYNKMILDSKELKEIIDSTPYPDAEYNPFFAEEKKKEDPYKEKMKQRRKEAYREWKNGTQRTDQYRSKLFGPRYYSSSG